MAGIRLQILILASGSAGSGGFVVQPSSLSSINQGPKNRPKVSLDRSNYG